MNKGGRPSKYNYEKFEKLLEDYLSLCADKYVKLQTYKRTNSKGSIHYKYEYRVDAKIPTLSGFASYIGISRETVYAWGKRYEEFNNLIEDLQNHQIDKLVRGGLSNIYNASICSLRLRRLGIGKHRTF